MNLKFDDIPGAWAPDFEGLPQPDWAAIWQWVEGNAASEEARHDVYGRLSRQWLEALAERLEGQYGVYEAPGFILLTTLPAREARAVLEFCGAAEKLYAAELPDVAQIYGYGPEAVLLFDDLDDYARYIAAFYPEREAAQFMGAGVHLGGCGNPHIALAPMTERIQIDTVLAHELVHACLCSQSLPRWLDEGLAMRLERLLLSGVQEPHLDAETAQRNRHYWNAERIQDFWTGASFLDPGKSSERSYLLADVLVSVIARNSTRLAEFVAASEPGDSGQGAAVEHLGLSLGEIAGHFLGDGDWEPLPDQTAV